MDIPETRYATTVDDVHIAYQVFGDGPVDLVYVQGFISNVDAHWDVPAIAGFLRRLARLARVITFDRRGSGVSDKPAAADTLGLEIGVEDIVAVMDAVGSEQALLWGFEDGGALSAVFAATRPERTLGLALFATWVRFLASEDYPWGWTDEDEREWRENVEGTWGSVAFWRWNLSKVVPDLAGDDATAERWARYSRLCASPGSMALIDAMHAEIDVRSVLPSIQAPTLLMHRVDDQSEPIESSRYMVSKIPGARLVELPGNEHTPIHGDVDAVIRELRTFIEEIHARRGRARPRADDHPVHGHRGLHGPGRRRRRCSVDGDSNPSRSADPGADRSIPGSRDQDDGRRVPRHVRRSCSRCPLRRGDRCRRPPSRDRDPRGGPHR